MIQKLIAEIGKSQRLEILNTLKRTRGLSVNELADKLDMSYMGIKQHCVELHHDGYLDTWRRPKPVGRPEMLYRLTKRAHELFPVTSNELTLQILEAAGKLYGPAAAEKLLFMVFQEKTKGYQARVKGAGPSEKARAFARIREAEGHMSQLDTDDPKAPLAIVEHHSPILDLVTAFPIVARLEADMFQAVLGVRVRRDETTVSGLYCCTFYIGQGAPDSPGGEAQPH